MGFYEGNCTMKSPAFSIPPITEEEHIALQMVYAGTAEPHQQRLAISLIVKKFCQPQDLLFIPGKPDETGFINGRAFPAAKIRHYVNTPVTKEINPQP